MQKKRIFAGSRRLITAAVFVLSAFFFGCGPEQKPVSPILQPADLNNPVEALAEIYQFNAGQVRGFGIAAGLLGTGSSECPPALRTELEKYIRQQLSTIRGLSPRQFLDSPNTAVVEINGTIPPFAEKKETFDVLVQPIEQTQTTSLDYGYVYTTPLKERSTFVRYDQYAKTFASAQGQLFRNKLDEENNTKWYLLGGGVVENEAAISLVLRSPSFEAANAIRNRLNERFGPNTASSVSSAEISLKIPPRYRDQKERFLQLVQKLYLQNEGPAVERYIESLLEKLKKDANKLDAEIGLEAAGKRVLPRLSEFLDSPDEALRFHAARCMLNLGDEQALPVMEAFCKDTAGRYCLAAIETVGLTVRPRKSEPILLRAVASDLAEVRLAAYRQLDRIQSSAITRNLVADSFVVDKVFCGGRPLIYVFRSEAPKIVLFGSPIYCKPDVFLQSEETGVLLNAKPEDKLLAVSRRHPSRPRLIGPIFSSRELSALIRTLGENADTFDNPRKQPGLAIPYQDIILLLKQLAEQGIVDADFQAGPMTQAGSFLQKTNQNDR
jgi:hypothetical protein